MQSWYHLSFSLTSLAYSHFSSLLSSASSKWVRRGSGGSPLIAERDWVRSTCSLLRLAARRNRTDCHGTHAIRSNCVVSRIPCLSLWSMLTNFGTELHILVDNKVWERRRSPGRLNFVGWRLKFVGSVPGNCVLSHSWRPEWWGGS